MNKTNYGALTHNALISYHTGCMCVPDVQTSHATVCLCYCAKSMPTPACTERPASVKTVLFLSLFLYPYS